MGSIPSTRKTEEREGGRRRRGARQTAWHTQPLDRFMCPPKDEGTDQRSQATCSVTNTSALQTRSPAPAAGGPWIAFLPPRPDHASAEPVWWPGSGPSLPMSPQDQAAKNKALQSMAAMSSAQIVSATAFHSKMALARGPGYPAISGVSGAAQSKRPTQLFLIACLLQSGTMASLNSCLLSPFQSPF